MSTSQKYTGPCYSRRVDNFDDFLDSPENFLTIGEEIKRNPEEKVVNSSKKPAAAAPRQRPPNSNLPVIFRNRPDPQPVARVVKVAAPAAPPQRVEVSAASTKSESSRAKSTSNRSGKTDCEKTASEQFDETFVESWKKNSAACSGCLTIVPHNQLFVCSHGQCQYSLQQKTSIANPQEFYRREKVFCGCCSFRGNHSPHSKYMRPACRLAIDIASGEVGHTLEQAFDEMIVLKESEPVDYVMAEMLDATKLEKIDVIAYLRNSTDAVEWNNRYKSLTEALEQINNFRIQGRAFVVEQAKQIATLYKNMEKVVSYNLETQASTEQEKLRRRLMDHLAGMGIKPDSKDAERAMKRLSLSSIQPISSESLATPRSLTRASSPQHPASGDTSLTHRAPSPAVSSSQPLSSGDFTSQHRPPTPTLCSSNRQLSPSSSGVSENSESSPDQTALLDALNADIGGSDGVPEISMEVVKMTYNSLVRRFEMSRDEMTVEAALYDVAQMLDEMSASHEHKLAAAQMFHQMQNFQLYWPLPEE